MRRRSPSCAGARPLVIVVSNSSPLIAGATIGLEAIFEALFSEIFIWGLESQPLIGQVDS